MQLLWVCNWLLSWRCKNIRGQNIISVLFSCTCNYISFEWNKVSLSNRGWMITSKYKHSKLICRWTGSFFHLKVRHPRIWFAHLSADPNAYDPHIWVWIFLCRSNASQPMILAYFLAQWGLSGIWSMTSFTLCRRTNSGLFHYRISTKRVQNESSLPTLKKVPNDFSLKFTKYSY